MKNIAVVAGGNSSEYNISLLSGDTIMTQINKKLYTPYLVVIKGVNWTVKQADKDDIEIDKNDFSFFNGEKRIIFDFAYITIHGTPGEDGKLQGYFEMINLPYSTCDVLTAALSFNKFACKSYLSTLGICMAKEIQILRGEEVDINDIIQRLGLPVFVKPNEGGSSFGITKVKEAKNMQMAINNAFTQGNSVIIEEAIEGRELTCGIMKTAVKNYLLPITEIITEHDFFNYNAKYKGESKEITPANIPEDITNLAHSLSSLIYSKLRCKGLVRIDYIYSRGKLYFLEINIAPGMTSGSLVPQQIIAMGETLTSILTVQIEDLIGRFKKM